MIAVVHRYYKDENASFVFRFILSKSSPGKACRLLHFIMSATRHGKSGNLGGPGLRKILLDTENLNKNDK